jgi:hypothetical protein
MVEALKQSLMKIIELQTFQKNIKFSQQFRTINSRLENLSFCSSYTLHQIASCDGNAIPCNIMAILFFTS